jgi:hypothetical protein
MIIFRDTEEKETSWPPELLLLAQGRLSAMDLLILVTTYECNLYVPQTRIPDACGDFILSIYRITVLLHDGNLNALCYLKFDVKVTS